MRRVSNQFQLPRTRALAPATATAAVFRKPHQPTPSNANANTHETTTGTTLLPRVACMPSGSIRRSLSTFSFPNVATAVQSAAERDFDPHSTTSNPESSSSSSAPTNSSIRTSLLALQSRLSSLPPNTKDLQLSIDSIAEWKRIYETTKKHFVEAQSTSITNSPPSPSAPSSSPRILDLTFPLPPHLRRHWSTSLDGLPSYLEFVHAAQQILHILPRSDWPMSIPIVKDFIMTCAEFNYFRPLIISVVLNGIKTKRFPSLRSQFLVGSFDEQFYMTLWRGLANESIRSSFRWPTNPNSELEYPQSLWDLAQLLASQSNGLRAKFNIPCPPAVFEYSAIVFENCPPSAIADHKSFERARASMHRWWKSTAMAIDYVQLAETGADIHQRISSDMRALQLIAIGYVEQRNFQSLAELTSDLLQFIERVPKDHLPLLPSNLLNWMLLSLILYSPSPDAITPALDHLIRHQVHPHYLTSSAGLNHETISMLIFYAHQHLTTPIGLHLQAIIDDILASMPSSIHITNFRLQLMTPFIVRDELKWSHAVELIHQLLRHYSTHPTRHSPDIIFYTTLSRLFDQLHARNYPIDAFISSRRDEPFDSNPAPFDPIRELLYHTHDDGMESFQPLTWQHVADHLDAAIQTYRGMDSNLSLPCNSITNSVHLPNTSEQYIESVCYVVMRALRRSVDIAGDSSSTPTLVIETDPPPSSSSALSFSPLPSSSMSSSSPTASPVRFGLTRCRTFPIDWQTRLEQAKDGQLPNLTQTITPITRATNVIHRLLHQTQWKPIEVNHCTHPQSTALDQNMTGVERVWTFQS